MGQRLNIEIVKGEKLLANAYYHWRGYTSSSFEDTNNLLSKLENNEELHQKGVSLKADDIEAFDVPQAIWLLETSGSGLTDEEKSFASEQYSDKYFFKPCYGRNSGLTSISEKGMTDTRYWEEARVTIDIQGKYVIFEALSIITQEEYEEDYFGDDMEYDNLELLDIDIDFTNIPFDEFTKVADVILKAIKTNHYIMRLKDGNVAVFIE